jgi:type VI protein secretion system component Hcp
MSYVSGSVKESAIRGRTFASPADTEVTIKLGGYANAVNPNGNNTSGMEKTAEAAGIEGLVVMVDHDKADPDFLQEIADGLKFEPFTITLVDGNTYQGKAQILDMPGFTTKKNTVELKLGFDGKITKQ